MAQMIEDYSSITTTTTTFCSRLADLYNTVGPVDCTTFNSSTVNFRAINGSTYKINPIASLTYYQGNPATTVNIPTYTITVDIDGDNRKSVDNVDVQVFYVPTTRAVVLPSNTYKASSNMNYLTASVRYPTAWLLLGYKRSNIHERFLYV